MLLKGRTYLGKSIKDSGGNYHLRTSPNISSYFVAKQQRSLWIQGLREKMIQAHSELCNWSFFPENAVDAGFFVVAVEI
jgi:hypothetical protein